MGGDLCRILSPLFFTAWTKAVVCLKKRVGVWKMGKWEGVPSLSLDLPLYLLFFCIRKCSQNMLLT